jgi:hypothetical protein
MAICVCCDRGPKCGGFCIGIVHFTQIPAKMLHLPVAILTGLQRKSCSQPRVQLMAPLRGAVKDEEDALREPLEAPWGA